MSKMLTRRAILKWLGLAPIVVPALLKALPAAGETELISVTLPPATLAEVEVVEIVFSWPKYEGPDFHLALIPDVRR